MEVTGAIKCDRPDHRSSVGRFIGKDLENKDHGSGIARLSVERDKQNNRLSFVQETSFQAR
jgi:hypothetical protein